MNTVGRPLNPVRTNALTRAALISRDKTGRKWQLELKGDDFELKLLLHRDELIELFIRGGAEGTPNAMGPFKFYLIPGVVDQLRTALTTNATVVADLDV